MLPLHRQIVLPHYLTKQNFMKKSLRFFAVVCIVLSIGLSSCTKEQMTINLLYGSWKLDSQLDNAGNPDLPPSNTTVEFIRTFYRCDNKQNTSCPGTTKTTTVSTLGGSTITTIDGSSFSYSVFGKSQLVIGGTYYEIESVKGKTLSIHPAEHPLATSTYSKL